MRLSRDEDRENYASILEQKRMIIDYALERDLELQQIFEDDNASGYTFNRSGLRQMLNEVERSREQGEMAIQAILTKDLSRIGRRNGATLMLIDDLIEKNVDLIMINGKKGPRSIREDEEMLGIETWLNEMYVRDISRKIKGSLQSKQKSGQLHIHPPYGYVKTGVTFSPDEEVAGIIQLIFDKYLMGNGYKRIADYLNHQKVMTPSQYTHYQNIRDGKKSRRKVATKWSGAMIHNIITNDVYIGIYRTKKYETQRIKGQIQRVPTEQHFVFYDHHQRIIGDKDFNNAQELRCNKQSHSMRNGTKNHYRYSGLVYCGSCRGKMGGRKRGKVLGYECQNYVKEGLSACTTHFVREDIVSGILYTFLNFVYKQVEVKQVHVNTHLSNYQQEILALEEKLKRGRVELKNLRKIQVLKEIKGVDEQGLEERGREREETDNLALEELGQELLGRLHMLEEQIKFYRDQNQNIEQSKSQREGIESRMRRGLNRAQLSGAIKSISIYSRERARIIYIKTHCLLD